MLAGKLQGGSNCLIEVDIRDRAIGLAKHEYEEKMQLERGDESKQSTKQI